MKNEELQASDGRLDWWKERYNISLKRVSGIYFWLNFLIRVFEVPLPTCRWSDFHQQL